MRNGAAVDGMERVADAEAVSVFDVDRTLTRLTTYGAFLAYAARRHAPWRLLLAPGLIRHAVAYRKGRLTRQRLKEAAHAALLGRRMPRERAEALAEGFAEWLADRATYPAAVSLIAAERAAGRRVFLATGASMLYMAPFARRLGVDGVVATGGVWSRGSLTHRISGENCYGSSKLRMIQARLEREGIDRSRAHVRFYSDHVSDLPAFEWADEPIAVNPHGRLRRLACRRRWRVLDWR